MNNEKSKVVTWLRISYWTFAIVDLIFSLALIFFPGMVEFIWQLNAPIQGADLMWSKYFGVMVLSWTCLNIWADRKPRERTGVILLTCFPVIMGLSAVKIYGIVNGFASSLSLGLLIVMLTCLFILGIISYIKFRKN